MDGQLCYQADVESLLDEVEDKTKKVVDKKKIVTEGLVFFLDYNENRMVEVGKEKFSTTSKKDSHDNVIILIGTIGKSNLSSFVPKVPWYVLCW